MPAARTPKRKAASADPSLAQQVWLLMSDLILDNDRRRLVSEAVGMSFSRTRALRRLARRPMSMSELAASLGIDPPNATTLVDELESLGLARRLPHPTDRRAKLVETTPKGAEIALRADEILSTPPETLTGLAPDELSTLYALLARVAGSR
jgi:DNA-binding MarR family transcriptional regulator